MDLLILGGPLYLGRHLIDAALVRGHRVTLFNRGRTKAHLYPEVERLLGDRDGDLSALGGRRWDAVIDTSAYLPRQARASAEALAGRVAHYVLVSSISVYADDAVTPITEASPVATLPAGAAEELTGPAYGALKAMCEGAVEHLMPGRATHVRAGLIFGPYDTTGRAAHWPRRLAVGGEVLAPGDPGQPVQLVDARDLADWMVRMGEARHAGVFNATGPGSPLTMAQFLETCRVVGGADARFDWVDEAWLLAQGVAPYSELPLWLPASHAAMARVDCSRAIAAGLAFRPLEATLRDLLAWDRACTPEERRPRLRFGMREGLSAEREAELLAAWRSAQPAA